MFKYINKVKISLLETYSVTDTLFYQVNAVPHFQEMSHGVPSEVNWKSNSSKCILGHVFWKSEPDPFAKIVRFFFFYEKAPRIKVLKP